jgi:hypothetical protein
VSTKRRRRGNQTLQSVRANPFEKRVKKNMKRALPLTETIDANQLLTALIAFKKGDFSVRLPVNQTGISGKIADTLNEIFELNENMCAELARVSTAVGKEGKIGQRASLPGGAGA